MANLSVRPLTFVAILMAATAVVFFLLELWTHGDEPIDWRPVVSFGVMAMVLLLMRRFLQRGPRSGQGPDGN